MVRMQTNQIQTITKEGEVKLIIDLTLNLNLNSKEITSTNEKIIEIKEEEKKFDDWEIPDFTGTEKINFGK